MNETTLKIHLSEHLYKQIKNLQPGIKTSACGFITRVADTLLPVLTKEIGYQFCDLSIYEVFKSCHDVKILITKDNYKRLKIAHCEINTFSMGVILRWLVRFAIDVAKKIGVKQMWRLLRFRLRRYLRNMTKITVSILSKRVKTKKKRIICKNIVTIHYEDIFGKMQTEELRL